jgi:hypothetical protein
MYVYVCMYTYITYMQCGEWMAEEYPDEVKGLFFHVISEYEVCMHVSAYVCVYVYVFMCMYVCVYSCDF